MSDQMTEVTLYTKVSDGMFAEVATYTERGAVTPVRALVNAREHYRRQLDEATAALAALDREWASVHHQRGIHVVCGRRLVWGLGMA